MARSNGKRVAITVAGAVIGIAATVYVVHSLAHDWSRVEDRLTHANAGLLALALVIGAASMTWMASRWTDVLGALGTRRPRRDVARWFFLGEIGKYVPGGVWAVVGRGEVARRAGVPAATSYSSVALSLVTLYLASAAVAVLFLPAAIGSVSAPLAIGGLVLLLVLGLAGLHPVVVGRLTLVAERLSGREVPFEPPSWPRMAGLVVSYAPSWVGIGTTSWVLARALHVHASFARVVAATVLSWLLGFLAVAVPAGAGVREAVFVAVAGLPGGTGAAVAVAARLTFAVVDFGAAALSASARPRRRDDGAIASPS